MRLICTRQRSTDGWKNKNQRQKDFLTDVKYVTLAGPGLAGGNMDCLPDRSILTFGTKGSLFLEGEGYVDVELSHSELKNLHEQLGRLLDKIAKDPQPEETDFISNF